jgi:D-alanyl-D-alanine carboxypeptidase-like protein
VASNGRLPASMLASIPGGRLERATAKSWLRLRAKIGKETGIWICPTSSRTAYRTYSEQQYFWNLYVSGHGNLAARPGTSNHGWGTTVDVPSTSMAAAINRFGASYGWQKRWSDAPSEWWHFKYSPGNDRHKGEKPGGKPKHPYHYMNKYEKHWRNVLLRERRIAKKAGGWDKVGAGHLALAKKAKAHLRRYMKSVAAAAKKDGGNWKKNHRRVRYNYMKKLVRG